MDEESCEVHPELDKILPETNSKKRKLKTPSQVEALEKLYQEHKYPSELLKLQLAEEQGLSERQVSGWFCHRRLKDKNMIRDEMFGIGRQEFSSGVIQDRGSALKQDSCSSTKQGEHMHSDIREVDSQRFYEQDYPAVDPAYENRGQNMHTRNHPTLDNASSDSSSASQGNFFPQAKDPYGLKPLSLSSRSSNYNSINIDQSKNKGYGMRSRYFHSQDEIENAAISAVKRQLGRHYMEDGPPVGVKFDSLPPVAFDSTIHDAINEPYYGDDPVHNSQSLPRIRKQSTYDTGYTRFNREHPQSSYPKGSLIKQIKQEPNRHNELSSHVSARKSSFSNYSNHYPDRVSPVDNIVEDLSREVGVLNRNRNHEMKSKHKAEGIRSGSLTNRYHPYSSKIVTSESASYSRLHNHDDSISHALQRGDYLDGRPSNVVHRGSEHLEMRDREHTRRMAKDEIHREHRKSKEFIPVKVKKPLKNETRRGKILQADEFLPRDYASRTPSPQARYSWEDQNKGDVAEMPTSFSEDDETATTSSMD